MTTETSFNLTLDPVFMMVRPREKDEDLALFNADEVIHDITSRFEGFPEAERLLSDFKRECQFFSDLEGTPMSASEVKLMALTAVLEQAYGLKFEGALPIEEDDLDGEGSE